MDPKLPGLPNPQNGSTVSIQRQGFYLREEMEFDPANGQDLVYFLEYHLAAGAVRVVSDDLFTLDVDTESWAAHLTL